MNHVDVLLVEDDRELREITRELLSGAGLSVATAADGREALERLETLEPCAIVADVEMPGMDGLELCAAVRASGRDDLPFLFVSGRAEPSDRVDGLRLGADDYIGKPVQPQELLLKVTRQVARGRKRLAGRAPRAGVRDLEQQLKERAPSGPAVLLGRYEVQEVIGRGGMGTVFRGWDPRLKRAVALKTLHSGELADVLAVSPGRLLEEAVMTARFNHPHIVAVYDLEDAPEAPFIVMELVQGVSLHQRLRLGRLDPAAVGPLLAAVARALAAAHAGGVLHRDVKPGNILLGRDGAIKLTDFGIAGAVASMVRASGRVFGTPGYVPPEVLRGEAFDESGDLFGLGVVAHRCLTGAGPPRDTAPAFEDDAGTLPIDARAPGDAGDTGPHPLAALARRLTETERERRPGNAAEVAEELDAIVARNGWRWEPAEMVPATSPSEAGPPDSRRPHARLLQTTRLLR